jgi:putative holliday junction resolvase
MRTLAIDLGQKRTGLAMSDEGGRFATPLDVLHGAPRDITDPILSLITRESVQRLVVGLPLNMDGTTGPAATAALAWARDLSTKAGVELVFVDERLSTFDAEQRLNDRKRAGERLTRQKKKGQLDALAAAGFLQEFLDGRLPAIDV